MSAGRPSSFTQELADAICEKLASPMSLRKICLSEDMPSQTTIFRWLADERYLAFREQYVRAREAQADALFDECLDIADDGSNDWMDNEGEKYNGDAVQRSRLRIDTRKWMAGKLRPKVYGERIQQDHTSSDGSMTPKGIDASKLSTEALREVLGAARDTDK